MRRYAVTLAWSVRPRVRQSMVIGRGLNNPSGPFANATVSSGKHGQQDPSDCRAGAKPLGLSTFPSNLCIQFPDGQKGVSTGLHLARALLDEVDSSAPCSHRTGAFTLQFEVLHKTWIDVPQIRPWLVMQPHFN